LSLKEAPNEKDKKDKKRRTNMKIGGTNMNVNRIAWIFGVLAVTLFAMSGTALAHVPVTSAAIEFDPDATANDGDVVTIIGTLTYTGGTNPATCSPPADCPHALPSNGDLVVGQTLEIQIRQSDKTSYDPTLGVACAAVLDPLEYPNQGFVNVPPAGSESNITDVSGQVSRAFDTTGLTGMSICFRSHHPADGGSHLAGSTQSQSGEIDLLIESFCQGVTLTNPAISGGTTDVNGAAKGPWTVAMDLTNCTGSTVDFKVQGGATAWAPFSSGLTVTDGNATLKNNKKNQVITWNVTLDDGDTETITFNVGTSSSTVPCDVTNPLSGAWSAAYIDPDTGLPTKSDYTDRATISGAACTP
jgi:hypothetical protein